MERSLEEKTLGDPLGSREGWFLPADEPAAAKPCPGREPLKVLALTFAERAELIRQECAADRNIHTKETQVLYNDKPLNAMPNMLTEMSRTVAESGSPRSGRWQLLSVAVDSGAAETVIPHKLVTSHGVIETDASRSGLNYASATGDPIPNLGEQLLPLFTREGTLRTMKFQAAPVSRALGSVMRMCQSGHRCVFDEDGSYIVNKITGEINWLREENGNFMLDVWVVPPEELGDGNNGHGFAGPP